MPFFLRASSIGFIPSATHPVLRACPCLRCFAKVLTALGQISTTKEAGLPASSVSEAIEQVRPLLHLTYGSRLVLTLLLLLY